LQHTFLNLGSAPPSNAYLAEDGLKKSELYYPLKLFVCDHCWLVQTEDYAQAKELFSSDYAYFSSVSQSWLAHAKAYSRMIIEKLGIGQNSLVVEVASNDGYLLKNFVAEGIPCLGIEPTASTADAAEKLGIPVDRNFFGKSLAQRLASQGRQADLIVGNNVYAHVPDINDFTDGIKMLLKAEGTVTLEFPHLMRLIEHTQFDTIYHEHFSYFSLYSVIYAFRQAGLRIYDIEELSTHGGSLRVYGCHNEDARKTTKTVEKLLNEEEKRGLNRLDVYSAFQAATDKIKNDLLIFLIEQKRAGKRIAAYGAAAKGNTLLNYAGVKPDLLSYVCDAAPSKQGRFLPGSHLPILHPDAIREDKPDIVLILPWNIRDEVMTQLQYIRDWGGQFVTLIPSIQVY
jgi:hypothetical protein